MSFITFELILIKIGFFMNFKSCSKIKPITLYRVFSPILEQLKKFIKNPIFIGMSSKFLYNISTCICIRKNYKNGEFSPSHF